MKTLGVICSCVVAFVLGVIALDFLLRLSLFFFAAFGQVFFGGAIALIGTVLFVALVARLIGCLIKKK